MLEQLPTILAKFADGEEDKSGTTRLDVLVASLRDGKTSLEIVAAALKSAIEKAKSSDQRYWEGVSFLVERLGLRNAELAQAIDRALTAGIAQPWARFFALKALGAVAGGLVPRTINRETALRSEIPSLWVDLAVDAYRGDPAGLQDALHAVINGAAGKFGWLDLRKRIPKLRAAMGDDFNAVAKSLANSLPDPDAIAWLEAVDQRYGTKLSGPIASGRGRNVEKSHPLVKDVDKWASTRFAPVLTKLRQYENYRTAHAA